jgi:tetratricopeptide (TPR) repeat protein
VKQSLLQAVRLLEEAVARDPEFVLAYCLLSRVHLNLYFGGADHTPARRELANAAIQTAARLQPEAGEVHLEMARYAYNVFRDYDRARAELESARRTLPNNAEIYLLSAALDRRQARWTESIRNWERAIELDPRNVSLLENAAFTYQGLHRYAEADRLFERSIAISPRNYYGRTLRALLPVLARADVRPLRNEISAILQEEPQAAAKITNLLFGCALWERDSAAADRALAAIPPEGISTGANFAYPREWYVGLAARAFNDAETAHTAFTAARGIAEKLVRDQPDYAPAWSLLGQIDAALGRKEEAIREGRRACELLPVSKDSWIGPAYVGNLAIIYAWTGENDLALEQLAAAVSSKSSFGVRYGGLKLDPRWDPLRSDPRFERLAASLAPRE